MNDSRGRPFTLYKQFISSNTRSSFFTERVIYVCFLPMSVELHFGSLSAFPKSIGRVSLQWQFLTVYKFSLLC